MSILTFKVHFSLISVPFEYISKLAKEVSLSRVQLFVTPWKVAYQALLSMGFSRQEKWAAISFSRGSSQPRD